VEERAPRRRDEPAVREPRSGLVALVELEPRFVLGRPFLGGPRQADPAGGVSAAPAGCVVVGRDYGIGCHTFSNVPKRSSCS